MKPIRLTRSQLRRLIKEVVVIEGTGANRFEPVDVDTWEHLEVGTNYMCNVGRERVEATFRGWIDDDGYATDDTDPERVRLLFTDLDNGVTWEAYLHGDRFCAGETANPITVMEF